MRAVDVSVSRIKAYINRRLDEGAANDAIKPEFAALKRMFNPIARKTQPKVDRVPHIPNIEVQNVKQGYFEDSGYLLYS